MRLFDRTRTALDAAGTVKAGAFASDPWSGHGYTRDDLELFTVPGAPPAYTVGLPDIPGLLGGMFGLDTAMLVPAFARGLNLITGVASGLPLINLDPATGRAITPQGLTSRESMSPGVPNTSLMRRTVADMVAHGIAYWQVTAHDGNKWPTSVRFAPRESVSANPNAPATGWDQWLIDGRPARHVIEFDTGTPGALASGWLALRTAIALETAANNYARDPLPQIALKSLGIDLDEDEARELVADWRRARQAGSTAYLNSQIGVETFGWSASELQLTEARQHAAIEVARILNLDPVWVGASPSGSSLTYQNRQDMNQALLDSTVMPLLRVIEQRLSMRDVTGDAGSRVVRFDTSAFLRANLAERVQAITAYHAAGIITTAEARSAEPTISEGPVPE